ncbi:hypothetical protein AB0G32_29260 [Streptomyces sp. NPDC023723]|uniref:hypothetical protein n=1 Tax=Streptomyces sp. NPDC023723 TaxID=3154323 RepID=UPI0033E82443
MEKKRARTAGRETAVARAKGTMSLMRWFRWVASLLTVSWALSWVNSLITGAQGSDRWWPLLSAFLWAGLSVYAFVTYRRTRRDLTGARRPAGRSVALR